MDIQSFIQSGLLETYVIGQCSEEERDLVERMAAQHPEVRTELSAIEQALESYASGNAVAPPAWMKGRILDAIDQEAATKAPPARGNGTGGLRMLQILAVTLAAAGSVLAYQLYRQQSEKAALETRSSELQAQIDDCARRTQQLDKLQQAVVLLRDRDTRAVPLDNGKGTAYAYYNPVRREVALDLGGLPAPPPGKHFQFWAIIDGKPVSMGMVDLQSPDGWQSLPYFDNSAALAISQETSPAGNPTPTEVIMVGNVPAG